MGSIKDFILHKLTLRVGYILAAFSSAKVIAFASSAEVQSVLDHAGVIFKVTDPDKLKTYIAATVLIGGEFVYHWVHEKFILPKVSDQ